MDLHRLKDVPIFDTSVAGSFALTVVQADLNSHQVGGISIGVWRDGLAEWPIFVAA